MSTGYPRGVTPRSLFRVVAVAEAVTWTLLIIGMVLKYVTHTTEVGVRIGGGLHGFVFLTYVVTTCAVAVDKRWPRPTALLALACAIVPYATIPLEVRAVRSGRLEPGPWRLGPGGDRPTGLVERLLAGFLRHPVISVAVALVVIAAVFSGLLALGPPTEW